jgi:MFS family permease
VVGRSPVAIIVGGQSFQALATGGIALFLPLIRTDLGLTFAQAGTLAVVSTFVYAMMQIPAGYVTDRIDPKRSLGGRDPARLNGTPRKLRMAWPDVARLSHALDDR